MRYPPSFISNHRFIRGTKSVDDSHSPASGRFNSKNDTNFDELYSPFGVKLLLVHVSVWTQSLAKRSRAHAEDSPPIAQLVRKMLVFIHNCNIIIIL